MLDTFETTDTPQFSQRSQGGGTDMSLSTEHIELEVTDSAASMVGPSVPRSFEDSPAKRGSTTASTADSGMGTLGSNDSHADHQVEHVVSKP